MTQVQSNAHRVEIVAAGIPAYFNAQTTSTWAAVGNTLVSINPEASATYNPNYPSNAPWHANEGQPAVIDDWCGGVASDTSLVLCAQGGHGGYAGNEAYVLNLNVASPAWVMEVRPSTSVQTNVPYYADGKPSSRHGEADQTFIPSSVTNGGRWVGGGYGTYDPSGGGGAKNSSYRVGSGTYDPQDFFADFPGQKGQFNTMAWDSVSAKVWRLNALNLTDGGLESFNPATNAWTARVGSYVVNASHPTAAIDTARRIYCRMNGGGAIEAFDLTAPAAGLYQISTTGSAPGIPGGPGLVYHPPTGRFLVWVGGATVYTLTPPTLWKTNAWAWGTLANAGGGATPTAPNSNGTYGRFQWISALNALVVVNATNQQAYIYKLP